MPEQYQDEIEEILKQAGESPRPPVERQPRAGLLQLLRQYFRQSMSGKGWPVSPGRVMLTAVLLMLAAVVIRPFIPGAVGYLGVAGILIFLVGYLMFFVKPRRGLEKKWRGQPIEGPSKNALTAWWEGFRKRQK